MLLTISLALSACAVTAPSGDDDNNEELSGETAPEGGEDLLPDSEEGIGEGGLEGEGAVEGEDEGAEDEKGDTGVDHEGENEGNTDEGGAGNTAGDTIINENITNNNITINGASSNSAYAVARGLRSAVSIYCKFERTVMGGTLWSPTPTTESYYATGSGVIYRLDDDGGAFIITNFHVVYDTDSESGISEEIFVYLYGMESAEYKIPVTYVGGSANYDIAVLRVDESEILLSARNSGSVASIELGNSDMITPGREVFAIGNPSTSSVSGISVTRGVVSVDSEYITMMASDNSGEVRFRVMRIDAAVNGGNSGGGLFDERGRLVGIVNAKVSSTDIEGIGYAIPVSIARAVADNIIDNCYLTENDRVIRVTVGIGVNSGAYSTEFDVDTGLIYKRESVTVASVTEGSIAEGSIEVGDIISSLAVNGKAIEVTRVYMVIDAMLDVRVGDTITFNILRDGVALTVEIEATEGAFIAY